MRRSLAVCSGFAALALALGACRAVGLGSEGDPAARARERVDLSFEGVEDAERERLAEVVGEELAGGSGHPVDKAAVDDAAYAIELHYRDQGYPDAEVEYRYEEVPGGRPRASFTVARGPRSTVTARRVLGVHALDDGEVEVLLADLAPGKPWVLASARRAVGLLRRRYLSLGFLDATVAGPEVELADDGGATVTIEVNEGVRRVVRHVEFDGELPAAADYLERLAKRSVGAPYTSHLVFRLRAQAVETHARRGYPDCTATVAEQLDASTGAVRLQVHCVPGERVRIAEIRVQGNRDVDAKRIRSRVELRPGDVFDPEKIDRSFARLYETGLFDSLSLTLEEGGGAQRALIVQVVETPSLELFAEPGYGSYEGPRLRLGVDERNLLGSGLGAGIEGHASPKARGVELHLTDPFLFSSWATGQASLFANEREEPTFTVHEGGAGVSLRRSWNEHLSTSLGYEYKVTTLGDVALAATVPDELSDSVNLGTLTLNLVRNTRDQPLMPTRGTVLRGYAGLSALELGSSAELAEGGFEASIVTPLIGSTLLAADARGAVIAPFGETSVVPLQRRLFNGGENSVRSFKESDLGPTDPRGEPLGGEARSVVSMELRRPIAGNLSGVLFYDAGNVRLDYQDFLDFEAYRQAVGVGARYLLPIGPLRLDFAVNPDPRDDEDDWVLQFAVGLPF